MTTKTESKNNYQVAEYSPSWVDHLSKWVNRLPGSSWVYYLGLGLLLFILQVLILWIGGIIPNGRIDPVQIFLAVAIPYMLVLINYFNEHASKALSKMRSALKINDKEFEILKYKLKTLPALPTLLAGLVGLSCPFLLETITGEPYQIEALQIFPIAFYVFRVLYLILWWVFGTFLFHTIHQLRQIGIVYTQYTRINLFRMKELYAFSNLTALMAGSMAFLPIGFLLVNPVTTWTDPVVFSSVVVIQIIALGTFIWPQIGIHRLLVTEKERLLEEANTRFEAMILELHQRVDKGKHEGSMDLSMTISSLQTELNTIEKIPTWPWQPETLRILITALALPLGLWFIQLILARVFGS